MKKNLIVLLFLFIAFQSCRKVVDECKGKAPDCETISIAHQPHFMTYMTMQLEETSGLIHAVDRIWTHNDRGWYDHIYAIDTTNGEILKTIVLEGIQNVDFEDLAKNNQFIFIGDFGNNDGDRKDLVIYRLEKSLINIEGHSIQHVPVNSTHLYYPEQQTFEPGNQHNFDCEAFIWKNDFYYLFTKHRTNDSTTLYRIPAAPGEFAAEKLEVFHAGGSITAADISPDGSEIVLLGYDKDEDVFLWFFSDFEGEAFFNGKRVFVNLGSFNEIGQAEAVTYLENKKSLLISAEKTGNQPPRLYHFPLSVIR